MSLTRLPALISDTNPKGFFRAYIELLHDGYSLSVPQSIAEEPSRFAWSHILNKISKHYPDEFLDELTAHWIDMVTRQGDMMSEQFIPDLLQLTAADKLPDSPADTPEIVAAPLPNDLPTELDLSGIPTQPTDDVDSLISDSYYAAANARNSDLLPLNELQTAMHSAIKKQDATAFLTHYLSQVRHQVTIDVPQSTVISIIHSKWHDIILSITNSPPKNKFLTLLAQQWFYWVNQKGIPHSPATIENLLYDIISQSPTKTFAPAKPSQKPGGLSSFFGKK